MDTAGLIAAPSPSDTKTAPKSRSFSDPPLIASNTPACGSLAPSPTLHERFAAVSKDDHDAAAPPTTPKASRRPDFASRGLSLQMPSSMPSPSHFPRPAPLSPQLDRDHIYMQQQQQREQQAPSQSQSPVTSLPRHSRGLDFSRACTNLHHSTLADGTPDSSPVVTQKAVMIPARKGSVSSMMLDSPSMNGPAGGVPWPALGPERATMSSSVGSVNMMASESESNDSDEDASMGGDDNEDPIYTTPQVRKLQNPNAPTPFMGAPTTPSGWATGGCFSPAQASLMKTIRRARLHKNGKRSRKSSSSASGSGYSSVASPRGTSPPPLRSIETAANNGYFSTWPTAARSRRESLALGTDGLHLSSGNDSGDEASANSNPPSTPGVVKRPVVRRGNLLPKTKGFARIRAALMEEAAPIDTEVRREAETIRQVRERDGSLSELDLTSDRPLTAGGDTSSPNLLPAVPEALQEDFGKDLDDDNQPKGLGMNFAAHASRNSGGLDYWNRYDTSFRTPPPNFARHSSSVMSDISMDAGGSETPPTWRRPRARSSASDVASDVASQITVQQPQPTNGNGNLMNDDIHLNRFKRRREDDFDISTIKRRAVSPGMSANNSPVLTQSPSQKEANANWGQPPEKKDKSQPQSASSETSQQWTVQPPSQQSSRHGSGGSSISLASGSTLAPSLSGGTGAASGKKLGLQGMVDTNDGLMKMSIE